MICGASPLRTQRSVMQTDWMVAFDGLFGNGLQRALFEAQLDLIVGQQLVILLAERVFRLGQDADEIVLAQSLQRGDDRQTADQLGDDAELQQIVGLDLLEQFAGMALFLLCTAFSNPMLRLPTRSSMIFSRPSNAPPQINRILLVSSWMNS